MKKIPTDELAAFTKGRLEWFKMEAEYNEPQFNAFGQRLSPHYCVHGVSNLWADYDDICQYCEDGIFTAVQWGKIRMWQYVQRRNREWNKLVYESLLKNAEATSEYMKKYLNFGMKQVHSPYRARSD